MRPSRRLFARHLCRDLGGRTGASAPCWLCDPAGRRPCPHEVLSLGTSCHLKGAPCCWDAGFLIVVFTAQLTGLLTAVGRGGSWEGSQDWCKLAIREKQLPSRLQASVFVGRESGSLLPCVILRSTYLNLLCDSPCFQRTRVCRMEWVGAGAGGSLAVGSELRVSLPWWPGCSGLWPLQ